MGGDLIEVSISLTWVGSGWSGTSRWVDGSEVSLEEMPNWSKMDENEFRKRYGSPSGSVKRRLVKRPKRVNSLDVEAMQIADAHAYAHHNKVHPINHIITSIVLKLNTLLADSACSSLTSGITWLKVCILEQVVGGSFTSDLCERVCRISSINEMCV